MKISQVTKDVLPLASPQLPVLLLGPPGVGKSDICAQFATSHKMDFIVEHPVISDPTDFKGLPYVERDAARWVPAGTLRRICDVSQGPILALFDDLGQAPPAVQAVCMQLLLARRFGDHAVAPQVTFITASNRPSDRAGIRAILSPLINRVLMVEIVPDAVDWATWALNQPDIDPLVPAYARFRCEDLFVATPPVECVAFCTPRSLTVAGRLVAQSVRHHEILAGLVGRATADDFLAFAQVADRLPSIERILCAPKEWEIPTNDPGLLHAVVCLAARAETDSRSIVQLADHLGAEWGTALLSDRVAVDPTIKKSIEFAEWAREHQELL